MKKPPLVVIVIAAVLMLTGAFGLVGDFMNFKSPTAYPYGILGIAAIHLLAIVAGWFMLRRQNWARWLAVAWMALHVAISFGHSLQQLIVHTVLLVLFAYGLFIHAEARTWFARRDFAP